MSVRVSEFGIAAASILTIGVGLWWEKPSWSLIGVGVIVLILTVFGRMKGARRA